MDKVQKSISLRSAYLCRCVPCGICKSNIDILCPKESFYVDTGVYVHKTCMTIKN